ncbi:toprim domain-containing protein [Flavobacterium sp. JAS]|uniref:toprim domain-containing protein n=1 Tax=Flavobacterium sp. JAS TaxID=2897329 RepID=UPI001E4771EE|nr:toprim domain-containing protein [Flavobacterium sp. JAS]MCD0468903.1 toprim domain-containing protein [Flavobacterium sp. JAS]
MNFSNESLSIDQIKTIDMVCYLSSLGFEPSRVSREDYWYLSPLRNENTASFKINRSINRWYDHGMGRGGNLIDFGMLFFQCSFGEFLKNYTGALAMSPPRVFPIENQLESKSSKLVILREIPLQSHALLKYLEERKIPLEIAAEFCKEVHYRLNDHTYYGIGFKNDLGGFEIRNRYFKASASPKGFTSYDSKAKEVLVFEGFFDFLSFKALNWSPASKKQDFIILNSLSFIDKARLFMEKHQLIRLFLDRDQPGQTATKRALSWDRKYKDESLLYKGHKDLNLWVVNQGKLQLKKIKNRPRL